jgi:hypothetical protein
MKLNFLRLNKSQVTIFIILIIILIFLFIFLFASNFEDRSNHLESEKKPLESISNDEINSVKNQVDYCLQKELKKALIISGLRGGFIYDKGEEYVSGIIPPDTYDFKLISNLGLNYNNLKSKTLLFNGYELKIPLIDSKLKIGENIIYNHSIKEDFDTFIFNNFLKCINKKIYEEKGFNLSFGKYIGKPITVSNNKIVFEGIEAKEGDFIKIILDNDYYIGNVTKVDVNKVEVLFNTSISTNVNLRNSFGINLNYSIGINTTFTKENVIATLNFPFIIKNNNEIKKYEDISVVENIKFRQYLLLSSLILNKKSLNKNLVINNTFLEDIIKQNNLVNVFDISKINILKTKLIDSPDEKLYLFSIISKEDKILGRPYVFNFAYYNKAPYLVKDLPGFEYDGERFFMYVPENFEYQLDLLRFTKDDQFVDNYLSHFIPQHYDGPGYSFDLNEKGLLKFKSKSQSSVNLRVEVSDKETKNFYDIFFFTTVPENKNNDGAKSCFTYKNSGNNNFPVNYYLVNYIFDTVVDNYHKNYGFFIKRVDPLINFGPTPVVFFSKACYFSKDLYSIKPFISTNNGNTYTELNVIYNNDGAYIDIPPEYFSNSFLKIKVEVVDKMSGSSVTEPYILDLFGSKCLGPKPVDEINSYGGDLSCCNIQNLLDVVDSGDYNSILSSISDSNIYSLGEKVLDIDAKFCYYPLPWPNSQFNQLNTKYEIIWQKTSLGNDITSAFEGHVVSKCQGVYPTAINNLESVTPTGSSVNLNLKLKGVVGDSFLDLEQKNERVKLTKISTGGVCKFCDIPEDSLLGFVVLKDNSDKDLIFAIGNNYELGTYNDFGVTNTNFNSETNDAFIYFLADENEYITRDGGINWNLVSNDNGLGGDPSTISKSKGYCLPGSNGAIGGIIYSPSFSFIGSDNKNQCTDVGYNGNLITMPAPNNWRCGTCYLDDGTSVAKNCDGSNFGCPIC